MPMPREKNARRRAKSILIHLHAWEFEPIQEAVELDGAESTAAWVRESLAKAASEAQARASRRRET